jgi:predicted signal transduction protein with EAL and GGDEF domain
LAGQFYLRPFVCYWNAIVRLGFFVLATYLLPALKAMESEKNLACTDNLTGIPDRRHFFELAETELDCSHRYKRPITLAYIDLDSFKTVNDQWGHKVGDKLLCAVVDRIKNQLRSTDIIARLGGYYLTVQNACQFGLDRVKTGSSIVRLSLYYA